MPLPLRKLTTKQLRFIQLYDGNATQAAIKAGYSPKTAYRSGLQNMQKCHIVELIQSREVKNIANKVKTREERQKWWSDMMDSAEKDSDRLKASELLGRSQADFIDRHMVSVGGSHADLAGMTEDELERELEKIAID